MYAPSLDSTTFIRGPFGWQIRRYPRRDSYVYLLHFDQPYYHAKHYLGVTVNLEARLQLHRHGRGAKLMKAVTEAGIGFQVARLWKVEAYESGRALERKLKNRHDGPGLCPICQHRGVDILVLMRQGHWPIALHGKVSKRRPMNSNRPVFVRRE